MKNNKEERITALDNEIHKLFYEITYKSLTKKDKKLLEDIVYDFLSLQELDTLQKIKDRQNDFYFRHFQLGMYIRNHYQLWTTNAFKAVHPDDVSSIIIARIYEDIDNAIKVISNPNIVFISEEDLDPSLMLSLDEEDED